MAKPSLELINIIRTAASKLESSTQYQWGHMGVCNCGFLAQEVTKLPKEEIHRRAMMRHGDWNEQLNDYCPTSGLPMDDTISSLLDSGFDITDLQHLERLSDQEVLRSLSLQNLQFNSKRDVVMYMKAWAALLEDQLLKSVDLPLFNVSPPVPLPSHT